MWTVDENGYYGQFGGAYIPEMLFNNVENLKENYLKIITEKSFQKELLLMAHTAKRDCKEQGMHSKPRLVIFYFVNKENNNHGKYY